MTEKKSFGKEYWIEEGGRTWVEKIDRLETGMVQLHRVLMERCMASPGEAVLDVGCGGALTSIELAQRVGAQGSVLGLDVSPKIISVAADRSRELSNLQLLVGDAGKAELGSDRFDLVFSRFGVMFFDEPAAAFANLRVTMKPAGRLVFMCWRGLENNPWMGAPVAEVFKVLPQQPPAEPPDPDAPGPFSLASGERIYSLLGSAGYSDIGVEAIDAGMLMGSVEDAVDTIVSIGPAAKAIADANAIDRAAAIDGLKELFGNYTTEQGVVMPCGSWIVTAGR